MVKGGNFASLSIVNSETMISTSPVGFFLFLLERSATFPLA